MYSFQSRVRYSEVDENENLTYSGIVNYLQDCTTFHSEAVGKGVHVLKEEKKVWFVLTWQIQVLQPIKLGEEITVSTWPADFRSMYGERDFTIKNHLGQCCIKAISRWVFMDVALGRPVKPEPEDISCYPVEPKLDLPKKERRISWEGPAQLPETFAIKRYQIDTNGHVNNGQYIQMALEYLPEEFVVGEIRVEYKIPAVYGDKVIPKVYPMGKRMVVCLEQEDGKSYAVVEFLHKE